MRIKTDRDGYITGFDRPCKPIDYVSIFPDMEMPDDLRDEYGNLQYKIQVDEAKGAEGEVQKKVSVVKVVQQPTASQVADRIEREVAQQVAREFPRRKLDAIIARGLAAMEKGEVDSDLHNYLTRREEITQAVAVKEVQGEKGIV